MAKKTTNDALPDIAEGIPTDAAPKPATKLYRFPVYWGGEALSPEPPRIHADLIALRRAIGGLQSRRQSNGPQFAVKSAKDLGIKLRDALDECGMVCLVVGQDGGNLEVEKGTAAYVKSLVRVGSADGSFVDFVGSGHGADRDDKAGGKASTYAWKDALVKGLSLPDAEMVDTDDEAGVSPERKRPAPAVELVPIATVRDALEKWTTADTLPAYVASLRAMAAANGEAGTAWGLALSRDVQAAKTRLGVA